MKLCLSRIEHDFERKPFPLESLPIPESPVDSDRIRVGQGEPRPLRVGDTFKIDGLSFEVIAVTLAQASQEWEILQVHE